MPKYEVKKIDFGLAKLLTRYLEQIPEFGFQVSLATTEQAKIQHFEASRDAIRYLFSYVKELDRRGDGEVTKTEEAINKLMNRNFKQRTLDVHADKLLLFEAHDEIVSALNRTGFLLHLELVYEELKGESNAKED